MAAPLAPDPADAKADGQFQPVHSSGYGKGLAWLLDYFTRNPYATAQSGEAGQLAKEVLRLHKEIDRWVIYANALSDFLGPGGGDCMEEAARAAGFDWKD
jgi:hypothetical protein